MHSKKGSLRREIGLFPLVAYGLGNIVGAGIYVLIGPAAVLAGGAIWFSFLLGAIVALFTGLSYAELASMYPKAASEYTYVGRASGSRPLSFVTEWTMLVTEIVAASTVAIGFAEYFTSVLPFPPMLIAALLLILLTAIVSFGIKGSLRINTALSMIAILGLILVVAGGLGKLGNINYTYSPNGFSGITAASILIFFAFIGFDNIVNLSEETKNPKKTIPRGLLISILISTMLYVLVGIVVVGTVPLSSLGTSEAPLALSARTTIGPVADGFIIIAALLTTFNTALVLLIVGSRIIYGMSEEGALPKMFKSLNRFGEPFVASILVLAVALSFLSLGSIKDVALVASFGSLLVFALMNFSALRLRLAAPSAPRAFRAPLSIGWLSVTALLGAATCIALLVQFNPRIMLLGITLPLSGFGIYLIFDRRGLGSKDLHLLEKRIKR